MTSEITKTSLLAIASIFSAVGGSMLATDTVSGGALLVVGVLILILRGWLKQKGYDVEAAKKA